MSIKSASTQLAQVGMSRPTEGEALVKMALRPINPADIRSVQGQLLQVSCSRNMSQQWSTMLQFQGTVGPHYVMQL